jgi:hypothetical protein
MLETELATWLLAASEVQQQVVVRSATLVLPGNQRWQVRRPEEEAVSCGEIPTAYRYKIATNDVCA